MDRRTMIATLGALGLALGGCAEAAPGAADVVAASDTTPRQEAGPTGTWPPFAAGEVTVGSDACCLSLFGDTVVWAEGGDVYGFSQATGEKTALVAGPAHQKDPVLSGQLLVWADDRDGDYDLWARELPDGAPYQLVGGEGDQDQPTLDGKWLAWIGRDAAPHDAKAAEVWVMDVTAPGSARPLTQDGVEQTEPYLHGDRVVWADYRASDSGEYVVVDDPNLNNADIYGWDLATNQEFAVTTDPSKQLRPAIEDDLVVWLDWRGINPEPKYSEFQVFVKRLGESEERRVAWSSWERPELWQRPAVSDGVIAWIAAPAAGSSYKTGVFAVRADGGEPRLVGDSPGVLDAVALGPDRAAWLGAGTVWIGPFMVPAAQR